MQLEMLLPELLVLQSVQDKAEENNTGNDTAVMQVQAVELLEEYWWSSGQELELLPPHDTAMGCRNNSYQKSNKSNQQENWKFDWRIQSNLELALGRMETGPVKDAGNEDILGDLLAIAGYSQAQLGRETALAAGVGRVQDQEGCQKWNEEHRQIVDQVDRPGEAEDNGNQGWGYSQETEQHAPECGVEESLEYGWLIQGCQCLGSEEMGGQSGCRETAMDR